jgi:hypothetical protein
MKNRKKQKLAVFDFLFAPFAHFAFSASGGPRNVSTPTQRHFKPGNGKRNAF